MSTSKSPSYRKKTGAPSHRRRRRRANRGVLLLVFLVLLLAVVAVFLLHFLFVRVDGRFIRRSSETVDLQNTGETVSEFNVDSLLRLEDPASMDLRGNEISVADYESLAAAYPQCDIRWDVPLSGGQRFDSESESITLSSLTEADVPLFAYFTRLRAVNAQGVDSAPALHALAAAYPALDVDWSVYLGGEGFDPASTAITLPGAVSAAELSEKLACFDSLTTVTARNAGLSTAEQLSLAGQYPALRFIWPVTLFGRSWDGESAVFDLLGVSGADADAVIAAAPLLSALETLEMTNTSLPQRDMLRIAEALGDTDVAWTFSLYGAEVRSTDEEIDLSGIQITDTSAVEEVLPAMHHLTKVVMSDCGISNEDMDALDKRHEDVRFVWTVYFGREINGLIYSLRTDADHFIASLAFGYEANREDLNDETIAPLKYCTDIVALDIGHQHVTKLDFLRDMKKLRFLIIAENEVDDISPLAELPELYYAELFMNPFHDISPLLECKNLRHLNICRTNLDNGELLAEMTWLDRLWYMSPDLKHEVYYLLIDSLPNTEKVIAFIGSATAGTWRLDPSYYEMRDLLGAYYMPGGTEWEH